MKESCETCEFYNNDSLSSICVTCLIDDQYQPKEPEAKEMETCKEREDRVCGYSNKMEKIQITEEQARAMICAAAGFNYSKRAEEMNISVWKASGYIKKTVVEEAEDMYSDFNKHYNNRDIIECLYVVEKMHEAIQYLKERVK